MCRDQIIHHAESNEFRDSDIKKPVRNLKDRNIIEIRMFIKVSIGSLLFPTSN